MNQVFSNVRGYVYPSIPQERDTSVFGVAEYDLRGGGGPQVIGVKT